MSVECESEECERTALYDLADGRLCGPHAVEADRETVQYLADAMGRIPTPPEEQPGTASHECGACGEELERERHSELVAALLDHYYDEHIDHE